MSVVASASSSAGKIGLQQPAMVTAQHAESPHTPLDRREQEQAQRVSRVRYSVLVVLVLPVVSQRSARAKVEMWLTRSWRASPEQFAPLLEGAVAVLHLFVDPGGLELFHLVLFALQHAAG